MLELIFESGKSCYDGLAFTDGRFQGARDDRSVYIIDRCCLE